MDVDVLGLFIGFHLFIAITQADVCCTSRPAYAPALYPPSFYLFLLVTSCKPLPPTLYSPFGLHLPLHQSSFPSTALLYSSLMIFSSSSHLFSPSSVAHSLFSALLLSCHDVLSLLHAFCSKSLCRL